MILPITSAAWSIPNSEGSITYSLKQSDVAGQPAGIWSPAKQCGGTCALESVISVLEYNLSNTQKATVPTIVSRTDYFSKLFNIELDILDKAASSSSLQSDSTIIFKNLKETNFFTDGTTKVLKKKPGGINTADAFFKTNTMENLLIYYGDNQILDKMDDLKVQILDEENMFLLEIQKKTDEFSGNVKKAIKASGRTNEFAHIPILKRQIKSLKTEIDSIGKLAEIKIQELVDTYNKTNGVSIKKELASITDIHVTTISNPDSVILDAIKNKKTPVIISVADMSGIVEEGSHPKGAHAMVVTSIATTKDSAGNEIIHNIKLKNSWGREWASKGFCDVDYSKLVSSIKHVYILH